MEIPVNKHVKVVVNQSELEGILCYDKNLFGEMELYVTRNVEGYVVNQPLVRIPRNTPKEAEEEILRFIFHLHRIREVTNGK